MGHVLMVIFSLLLAFVVLASGAGKFRKAPQVMAALRHIGVHARLVALLAAVEVVGGVCLLIGLASAELGEISSTALAVYFLAMIAAHWRVGDVVTKYLPVVGLFLFAACTAIFQFIR